MRGKRIRTRLLSMKIQIEFSRTIRLFKRFARYSLHQIIRDKAKAVETSLTGIREFFAALSGVAVTIGALGLAVSQPARVLLNWYEDAIAVPLNFLVAWLIDPIFDWLHWDFAAAPEWHHFFVISLAYIIAANKLEKLEKNKSAVIRNSLIGLPLAFFSGALIGLLLHNNYMLTALTVAMLFFVIWEVLRAIDDFIRSHLMAPAPRWQRLRRILLQYPTKSAGIAIFILGTVIAIDRPLSPSKVIGCYFLFVLATLVRNFWNAESTTDSYRNGVIKWRKRRPIILSAVIVRQVIYVCLILVITTINPI